MADRDAFSNWNYVWAIIIPRFVLINFVIVKKTTVNNTDNQKLSENVITSFMEMQPELVKADTLFVLADSISSDPLIIESAPHLRAILDIKLGIDIPVIVKNTNIEPENLGFRNKNLFVSWNPQSNKFDFRQN